MLVLTRKNAELIQIGDDIVIKVIRTGPGTVKLGIDAPKHVRVMRGELNEKLAAVYRDSGSKIGGNQPGESVTSAASSSPETADVMIMRLSELTRDDESATGSRKKGRGIVV